MSERIEESEGRELFGLNPDGYEAVRPDYPDTLYAVLVERQALTPDVATLDVGSGSGLAARRLATLGANPLVMIEPDRRFIPALESLSLPAATEKRVLHATFEDAQQTSGEFGLLVAATSFHWLAPQTRVDLCARALRPGGHAVLMWNVFGDPGKDDAFHDATAHLLAGLADSPSGAPGAIPFALRKSEREAEFASSGCFELDTFAEVRWRLKLDSTQIGLLYESFSSIQQLAPGHRTVLLANLMEVADQQFDGRVERNMVSPLYLFRRV
jgi:SAM-dependent methyltransferase